jgi:hypothetical protein
MAPSATAAAEKMNVFYAGIENPVSVSASVSAEKVSITVSEGASYAKTGPGKYNISVSESAVGKSITVTTHADIGGKSQVMGSQSFRVKRVPNPKAKLSGKFEGGKAAKADLTINPFITASLGDDFVYDLRWNVNSYNVTFIEKGIETAPFSCSGNQFTEAVKSKINSSPAGTAIYFSEIKVSCVAGSRSLDPIAIILK